MVQLYSLLHPMQTQRDGGYYLQPLSLALGMASAHNVPAQCLTSAARWRCAAMVLDGLQHSIICKSCGPLCYRLTE